MQKYLCKSMKDLFLVSRNEAWPLHKNTKFLSCLAHGEVKMTPLPSPPEPLYSWK